MGSSIEAARAFLAEDPDPETRAELEALLSARGGRGRGGREGARRPVRRTPRVRHRRPARTGGGRLRAHEPGGGDQGHPRPGLVASRPAPLAARRRGVVVGFDGRYSSRQFAEDTAAVLAGLGIPVHLFPDPVPTPLCAFAVPQLSAAAGVMVTASHNPPQDNGYKVYRETGSQIIPPVDAAIAARIAARAPRARDRAAPPPPTPPRAASATSSTTASSDAYLEGVARGAWHRPEERHRCASSTRRCTASAIAWLRRAFLRAGFQGVARRAFAERPGRRLPHRPLPEPRGEGSDGPRARPRRRHRRRARPGQRSRRRSAGGRGARRAPASGC